MHVCTEHLTQGQGGKAYSRDVLAYDAIFQMLTSHETAGISLGIYDERGTRRKNVHVTAYVRTL